jgi:phosphatidylglycerophosphate synthase
MDGKQARRTGAGSPMGMLFDHGTDAMVACMSPTILGRIMQSGSGFTAMITFYLVFFPFWFFNLTEYYCEFMSLPAVIGPEDTQLGFCILALVSAFGGYEFWGETYPLDDYGFRYDIKLCHIVLCFAFPLEVGGVFVHFWTKIYESQNQEGFKSKFSPVTFLLHFSFLFIMIGVWMLYALTATGSQWDKENFNLFYLGQCAHFLIATHRMMVCDVTKAVFYPIRRTHLVSWGLLIVNAYMLNQSGGQEGLMDERLLFIGINVISWFTMFH